MFGIISKLFKSVVKEDPLLEELKSYYGLEYVESEFPVISGSAYPKVWKGNINSVQFGIRDLGSYWELTLGEIDSICDLILEKKDMHSAPQSEDELSIGSILGDDHKLNQKYQLGMICHDNQDFLGPQLKDEYLQKPLMEMSDTPNEVILYRRGVEVQLNKSTLDRSVFDRDLKYASEAAKVLQQRHR